MKALILVLLTGCSFVMTSGPSDTNNPPRAYPRCTSSMTWPIVDGVFSGIFVAGMASAIAEAEPMPVDDEDEPSKAEKITSLALFAAATGIGAYVGYKRVSSCRASREQFRAAYPYGVQPYAPHPYPYQPQGYPQPYQPPYQPAAPQPYPPQPYQPAAPQPAPQPPPGPPPAAPALGTEGDVCASAAECATGLACTNNVCVRAQ